MNIHINQGPAMVPARGASIAASCPQGRRANIILRMSRAGILAGLETEMSRALPPNWVSTDNAHDQLLDGDQEWKQRRAARDAAWKQPEYAIYKVASESLQERSQQLTSEVIASIAARELVAVWLLETNGTTSEYEVPPFCWSAPEADVAITTASSLGLPLSDADRQRFSKAPLCFRRAEWDAWIANRKAAIAQPSADATLPPESAIRRWLEDEMAQRSRTGGDQGRDAMVLVLRERFPMPRVRARRLVSELPPSLRAKRGRKPNSGQE